MTQAVEATDNETLKLSNQELKEALYKELELNIDIGIRGIGVQPENLRKFGIERAGKGGADDGENSLPPDVAWRTSFNLLNENVSFKFNPLSPYVLEEESGSPVLNLYKYGRKAEKIGDVEFYKKPQPPLSDRKTSDGVPFKSIASISASGRVHTSYSKECVLQEKGEACLFCNYEARKSIIKTPQQVAEVFAAAYEAGVGNHFIITGGFVPERRELEYYLDVAEEIRNRTGLKEFSGTAIVGAPLDFNVLDKYRQAGFSSVKMNVEIWDKNIWKTMCPGKDRQCGGWDNWVKALEYAAGVFGRGKVGANIVAGIEPKKGILEGIEYLATKGVIGTATIWRPRAGSDLEGHQTPETSWHFDLAKKAAAIYRKYGFTLEQICSIGPGLHPADIVFQIEEEYFEDGKLKKWKYPVLKK